MKAKGNVEPTRAVKAPRLWLSIVELVLGVSMLAFAAVYVALGSGYQECQNPATFTVDACTTLVEVSVVGLIGFGLTFFGFVGTLIGGLVRAGHLTPRQRESHPQVASAAETEMFLSMANSLLGLARIPRASSVGTTAWSGNLPWYTCRFKREGFRKPPQLVLSASLRGSMAPDDWRTLLAYYITHLKPRFSLAFRVMAELMSPFLALGLILAAAKFYWNGLLLSLTNAIIGILYLVLLIRIFPLVKKMSLKQDVWAANSLGGENLIGLFEKIDSLKLPDVENGKRRTGWILPLWPMPNITERMRNLRPKK